MSNDYEATVENDDTLDKTVETFEDIATFNISDDYEAILANENIINNDTPDKNVDEMEAFDQDINNETIAEEKEGNTSDSFLFFEETPPMKSQSNRVHPHERNTMATFNIIP